MAFGIGRRPPFLQARLFRGLDAESSVRAARCAREITQTPERGLAFLQLRLSCRFGTSRLSGDHHDDPLRLI